MNSSRLFTIKQTSRSVITNYLLDPNSQATSTSSMGALHYIHQLPFESGFLEDKILLENQYHTPPSDSCTVSRNQVSVGLGSADILHSKRICFPPLSCLIAGF